MINFELYLIIILQIAQNFSKARNARQTYSVLPSVVSYHSIGLIVAKLSSQITTAPQILLNIFAKSYLKSKRYVC